MLSLTKLKVSFRRYRALVLRLMRLAEFARGLPNAIRARRAHKALYASNLLQQGRKVVFVSEQPSWREAKLAFGLRRAGWDVILLHHRRPAFSDFSAFSDLIPFSTPWEGVELAHHAKARLFHVFTPNSDLTSTLMTTHKPGRVIFDIVDYFCSVADGFPSLRRKFAADIGSQAYCLSQADAVCARDLQLQYKRKRTRAARGKPVICFPEYCWNIDDLPEASPAECVRVVQIGWMGFERRNERDVGCLEVFRRLVQAGCEGHIYLHPSFPQRPSRDFEWLFADYLDLQAKTGRVQLHPTVPPEAIVSEISRYDLGLGMVNALTFDMPWTSHNPARMPLCGSSRVFDYLDAGLGLLLNRSNKFMFRTFSRYGVVFDGTELVRNGRLHEVHKPPRDRIAAARAQLSIERQIGRLVQFYGQLL